MELRKFNVLIIDILLFILIRILISIKIWGFKNINFILNFNFLINILNILVNNFYNI